MKSCIACKTSLHLSPIQILVIKFTTKQQCLTVIKVNWFKLIFIVKIITKNLRRDSKHTLHPSLNTQSCIKGLLVVWYFCFWAVWAAGPVHKKKLGADYEQLFRVRVFMFSGWKFIYFYFFLNFILCNFFMLTLQYLKKILKKDAHNRPTNRNSVQPKAP